MRFNYYLTAKDYRSALYFGTAMRMHKALKLAFIICACALSIAVSGYIGLFEPIPYSHYILFGYFVWFVYLFAVTEHAVLKYVKSKDNMLGKKLEVSMSDEGMFSMKVEGEREAMKIPAKNLFFVFENSSMYNIYINERQTVLLPKRVMADDEIRNMRSIFDKKLKDRFQTRFDDNNQPIKSKKWYMPI